MKTNLPFTAFCICAFLSAFGSDEIPGRVEDVAASIARGKPGPVYELTVRVTYPPKADGRVFAVADETGSMAVRRRFDWPKDGALKRGDLIVLRAEIGSTATFPLSACYRDATVLARDEKAALPDMPGEEEILEMLVSGPSWWTRTRLTVAIASAGALFLLVLLWNASLRLLVERRSRELLRANIAHADSELKIGERTRLAMELHDSVAQNLAGVSLQIDAALRNSKNAPEKAAANLSMASTILKTSREELRNCLWDLRSQALDEGDMNTAVRQTLQPVVADVPVSVRFDVPRKKLSDNTAHAVLRIIRELVANAVRHGNAGHVSVEGVLGRKGIEFSVSDDGCGFDVDAAPGPADGHFGLTGIRERLSAFSGRMTIDSAKGKGTRVAVVMT